MLTLGILKNHAVECWAANVSNTDESCIAKPKNCGSEVGRGERQEVETGESILCRGAQRAQKMRRVVLSQRNVARVVYA
jgi:hypothetical protein